MTRLQGSRAKVAPRPPLAAALTKKKPPVSNATMIKELNHDRAARAGRRDGVVGAASRPTEGVVLWDEMAADEAIDPARR
jgi:hypothetical protein